MVTPATYSRIRLVSLKKEATLLFLAVFYFVIATNTQTGWLFVLSAFLLGVLCLSWGLSRRSIGALNLSVRSKGEPRRGYPFRIELTLTNGNPKTANEVKVQADCPQWAEERPKFEWAAPKIQTESSLSTSFTLTPKTRGEHKLPRFSIVCGAPFGLFTVSKEITFEGTFLVYPGIEKLPLLKSRSRVATALGEVTSPTGRGDTHSLRSVREYRPGDDLRQVHWKASAKRGAGMPLLIREHHAPAPNRILLFLDTSSRSEQTEPHSPFERAVVLAASILWSATREGTQSGLALRQKDGQWRVLCHWPEQYRSLARVGLQNEIDFGDWTKQASALFYQSLPKGFRGCRPFLIKGAIPEQKIDTWPDWLNRYFVVEDPDQPAELPSDPKLVRLIGSENFRHV